MIEATYQQSRVVAWPVDDVNLLTRWLWQSNEGCKRYIKVELLRLYFYPNRGRGSRREGKSNVGCRYVWIYISPFPLQQNNAKGAYMVLAWRRKICLLQLTEMQTNYANNKRMRREFLSGNKTIVDMDGRPSFWSWLQRIAVSLSLDLWMYNTIPVRRCTSWSWFKLTCHTPAAPAERVCGTIN